MKGSVSILNKTKGTLPRVPFLRMKDAVLGPDYELSLVFVGDEESRDISIKTKNKDYIPNVLSFPLGPDAGEVFINPLEAARQAPDFDRTPSNMIAFLYIHALCHLKGMDHGATMERTEAKFRKEFGV
jgi:rRNA maturation RNase YbeY